MGDYIELRKELDALQSRLLNELIPPLKDMQAKVNTMLLEAMNVAGQIRVASERFINRANDEIEAEGKGNIGRRKRSTDLGAAADKPDAPSVGEYMDPKVGKTRLAVALPPMPTPYYVKAEGKRGCGNCGQPGHRRTSCPKPDKNANKPMGKRGCSKCGKAGHRAPTCPN